MTSWVTGGWRLTWGTSGQEALSDKGLHPPPGSWGGEAYEGREAAGSWEYPSPNPSPRAAQGHTPGFPPTSRPRPSWH